MECLYGTHSDNICVICKFHSVGLTVRQLKNRECLKKQCHYLVKNETHDYWRQRAVTKQRRIDRKERLYGGIKNV